MAQQHRQAHSHVKEDPYELYHNRNHTQQPHPAQGQPPHLQQPHSRPPSIVHQQHHQQQHSQAPTPPQQQHQGPYAPVYQQQSQTSTGQHAQDLYNYQSSPYNAPPATSGYTSAEMMAATMSRPPYPPMSYHTPQSNSPASVASTGAHDQQRSMYGQPPPQLHHQPMYYGQQPQYQQLPPASGSPYGQHAPPPHQSMASQPSMMMSHGAPSPVQHQMAQHASQHSPVSAMAGSPRHAKMEVQSLTPQLSRQSAPQAPSPLSMGQVPTAQGLQASGMQSQQSLPPHAQHPQHLQHPQHPQHPQHAQHQQHPQHNGASPMSASQTGSSASSVVNPNAAPGPIPATTPLVVRQDQNGVQWIAFEYSRDRVKMEYTIRCDVESVSTEELSTEFKQENCVYPRACCPREQYRGNRLQYESECNTVGWALAQLNPPLRGKRGLIQRAVDSWRNSNQDPRLRSRRVRRMAKIGSRKAAAATPGLGQPSAAHLGGVATLSSAPVSLSKPMPGLPPQLHHHDGSNHTGGDEVGESGDYVSDGQQQQRQSSLGGGGGVVQDSRPAHVFTPYGGYHSGAPSALPAMPTPVATAHGSSGVGAGTVSTKKVIPQPNGLFPDLEEAKKRKFVLVEDRGSRLRVRVTLNMVDTSEIPDSFRRSNSAYPSSFFPIEMESPPPSPTGRRFFSDDIEDDDVLDDGFRLDGDEVEASGANAVDRRHRRRLPRGGLASGMAVSVPGDGGLEVEVDVPRMHKGLRRKQVRLNDLGCRMAWLQSRAFAGRRIFLQKALDTYRGKTCNSIMAAQQDVASIAPHYEMRSGKKRWLSCEREMERRQAGRRCVV